MREKRFLAAVFTAIVCIGVSMTVATAAEKADPYLWLEEVRGESALAWVKKRNDEATTQLVGESDEFAALQTRIRSILDSDDRIPFVTKLGDQYYNFWQDEDHERGIWRRTTFEEYRKADPNWEVVLDIDKLGETEGESWVWQRASTLRPTHDRALVSLSRGGSDAAVVREFDLNTKSFVAHGFQLEEAKSDVAWIDKNTILVGTDFGPGSLTESGYARIVKRWTRGQPLAEAQTLFEAGVEDVAVAGFSDQTRDFERVGVIHAIDFYNSNTHLLIGDELVQIDKPGHASVSFFREWLLIEPKEDWELDGVTHRAGSLLAANLERYLSGDRELHTLFEPTASRSLAGYSDTRNYLLLSVLDNVRDQVEVHSFMEGKWQARQLHANENFDALSVWAVDANESDDFFITRNGYLTPTTLARGRIGIVSELDLKRQPHFFTTDGLKIAQHWATSLDGTKIPYFEIGPETQAEPLPTLLYGYGGFEVPLLPGYQAVTGAAWLEAGGIYVVANIRGGGEFGPTWHRAALKEDRNKAYEDFIAVAEDLIAREATTSKLLGTTGGSNGGLLMGNMLTMRPDLFGAIAAAVPLFDMHRYHLLLAGASWVAEYGDPDNPDEWKFLKSYSPYHNLEADADYPPVLVTTSTEDDRVHPGHARKLVARMLEFGHDVTYYENLEGGHAGAADNKQRAFMSALQYRFLWDTLRPTAAQSDQDAPN